MRNRKLKNNSVKYHNLNDLGCSSNKSMEGRKMKKEIVKINGKISVIRTCLKNCGINCAETKYVLENCFDCDFSKKYKINQVKADYKS